MNCTPNGSFSDKIPDPRMETLVTSVPLSSNTATTRGQSPDWVNPLVHEGEVTVEHQLPGNIAVSAGYIFSRGLRLPMFIDSNLAPSTTTKTYDVTTTAGTTQTALAKTCTNTGVWSQATVTITAGHSYTLTLISHDDNFSSDPTYTEYDDLVVK